MNNKTHRNIQGEKRTRTVGQSLGNYGFRPIGPEKGPVSVKASRSRESQAGHHPDTQCSLRGP